jgi:hypothetical protein
LHGKSREAGRSAYSHCADETEEFGVVPPEAGESDSPANDSNQLLV